eukprot:7941176-Pyramimonas_sp.AAC.1
MVSLGCMQIYLVHQPSSQDSKCLVAPVCALSALAMPIQFMLDKLRGLPCSWHVHLHELVGMRV